MNYEHPGLVLNNLRSTSVQEDHCVLSCYNRVVRGHPFFMHVKFARSSNRGRAAAHIVDVCGLAGGGEPHGKHSEASPGAKSHASHRSETYTVHMYGNIQAYACMYAMQIGRGGRCMFMVRVAWTSSRSAV